MLFVGRCRSSHRRLHWRLQLLRLWWSLLLLLLLMFLLLLLHTSSNINSRDLASLLEQVQGSIVSTTMDIDGVAQYVTSLAKKGAAPAGKFSPENMRWYAHVQYLQEETDLTVRRATNVGEVCGPSSKCEASCFLLLVLSSLPDCEPKQLKLADGVQTVPATLWRRGTSATCDSSSLRVQ